MTKSVSLSTFVNLNGIIKATNGGEPVVATGADLPVMTATVGGSVPTPPNDTTKFLRGDGTWGAPGGVGTVTSVSVVSTNGFAGSVATATSTPAITISTTITGLLKGNGTAVSAAVNSDLPVMSATVGGAVPTPPNNTTTYLRGDGTWATPAGGGTVTAVSVSSANGFSGTSTGGSTPALAISVTVSGLLKASGGAISGATSGADYAPGTAALATGIVKSTTSTGALSIATGADLPVMTATIGGAVPTPPNNVTMFLRGDGIWAAPAGVGTVTNVTTTAPANVLTINNGTSTPQLVMGAATGSLPGYLSAADWSTFNAKASATGNSGNQFAVATATLAASAIPLAQGDARYAALAGLSTQAFSVANASTSTQAVALGQADARYAALNGNSGNAFQVANPLGSTYALNQGYADTRYAALAGSLSQTFNVANAVSSGQAINLGQANSLYATLAGTNAWTGGNSWSNTSTMNGTLIVNSPISLNSNSQFEWDITTNYTTPDRDYERAAWYIKHTDNNSLIYAPSFSNTLEIEKFATGSTGGMQTLKATCIMNNPNTSAANQNYCSGVFLTLLTNCTTLGSGVFGLNPYAIVDTGNKASNVCGMEVNVSARSGSTISIKSGITIANLGDDAVQASPYSGPVTGEAALTISSTGGVGWRNGIRFTNSNGAYPLNANGSILVTEGVTTCTAGIDISSWTYTAQALKTPHTIIDDSSSNSTFYTGLFQQHDNGFSFKATAGTPILQSGFSFNPTNPIYMRLNGTQYNVTILNVGGVNYLVAI